MMTATQMKTPEDRASSRLSADALSLVGRPDLFIGGSWITGEGPTFTALDPFTELPIAEVPSANLSQVHAAAAAAQRAFQSGAWSRRSPQERSSALHQLAELMTIRKKELVEIVVAEGGCPIALARSLQVELAIEHLRWFAEKAAVGPEGGWTRNLPALIGPAATGSLLIREPIGVVACMTPYNVPILTGVWKLAGALAAGCTTILMPAPRAQLTGIAFARIIAELDLPQGVFNLVLGGPEVGRALTESPDVDMITFTGSDAVGRLVMAQGAATFKRVVLELGGKSPNIVLRGADVDQIAGPSILRFCRNAGQGCGATTRSFVPREDYERFVDCARTFISTMAIGDPWDEPTIVGPLIRAEHRARVEGYVERALAAGGRIEAGGGRPTHLSRGFFMNPVLLGSVPNSAEIAQDELFGPVGVIAPYDDLDEMIAVANQSRYGLNANVWGQYDEAMSVANRIRSGSVTINGGGAQRPDAPFGGFKHSGIGRELGEEGFLEFLQVKHVQWKAAG